MEPGGPVEIRSVCIGDGVWNSSPYVRSSETAVGCGPHQADVCACEAPPPSAPYQAAAEESGKKKQQESCCVRQWGETEPLLSITTVQFE